MKQGDPHYVQYSTTSVSNNCAAAASNFESLKNANVPILYQVPAFDAFDDFSDFVKSINYGASETCQ